MAAMLSAPGTPPGSGASAFFTSSDQTLEHARQLMLQGACKQAEELLGNSAGDSRACAEGLEIIRRLRMDYSSSPDELLKRVASSVPDVKAQDLERWREAGQLQ